ncbi:MAG: hypothetical protein H6736_00370 [Alphaproteobacteria bacterium]|nr:hypothetical protein [Alphaproteobacteria bacterium]
MERSRSIPTLGALLAALGVCLIFPFTPGGDAFAVYFPVVWGWVDGEGLSALLHLENGVFRAPGYPLALYLLSGCGAGLTVGIVGLTLASAAVLGGVLGAARGPRWGLVAVLAFVITRPFVSAATDVTPDLLGTAVLAASTVWVTRSSQRSALLAGLALGGAILTRFNFVTVAPVVLGYALFAGSPRRFFTVLLGLAAVEAVWSAVGLSLGRGVFWTPSGPTPLGAPKVIGGITGAAELLADPLEAARLILERLPGTFEALWSLGGAFVVILAGIELLARLAFERKRALFPVSLVISVVLPLALVRIEERYYLFAMLVLAGLATDGLRRIATKSPHAALAVALVLGGFSIHNAHAYARFRYQRFVVAADIVAQAETVADLIADHDAVVADGLAYQLSPLRLVRRPRPITCCEPVDSTEAFVRLRRRDQTLDPPAGFREYPLGPASFFRLFLRP